MKKIYILILMSFLLVLSSVSAANWYMSNNGSDTGTGSISNPINSFSDIFYNLSCGDTLYVRGGNYDFSASGQTLANKNCGLASMIDITNYPNEYPLFFHNVSAAPLNGSNSTFNMWNYSISTSSVDIYGYIVENNESVFIENATGVNGRAQFYNRTQPEIRLWWNNSKDVVYLTYNNMSLNPTNREVVFTKTNALTIGSNLSGITIQGIEFKYGLKGIATSGSVHDVFIDGVRVHANKPFDGRNSPNVTITNSELFMKRLDNVTWNDMKSSVLETSCIFLQNDTDGWNIQGNNIHGCFNGIYADDSKPVLEKLDISFNWLHDCFDDAIEFEDFGWSYNVTRNNITDSFVGVSLAPTNSTRGLSHITYNLIEATKYIPWDNAGTFYYAEGFKILDPNDARFFNITHNTVIGRAVYSDSSAKAFYNTTFLKNIFYQPNADKILQRSGEDIDGVFYDRNMYWRTDGGNIAQYWNNDTNSTEYATLSSFKASAQWNSVWEVNGNQSNPLFYSYENDDYRLNFTSLACTMSESNSYIGAFACMPDIRPNISNAGLVSATNSTLLINWTAFDYDGDYNYTAVYYNTSTGGLLFFLNVNVSNVTVTGLSSETYYTVTLVPYDMVGHVGPNISVTAQTLNNPPPATSSNYCVLSNSTCSFNVTFIQRPYIIYGLITLNTSGIVLIDNTLTADSNYCTSEISECADANDNSYIEQAFVTTAGTSGQIEQNFTVSPYSPQVYLNSTYLFRKDGDTAVVKCKNSTGWEQIDSISGSGDSGEDTEILVTLVPSECYTTGQLRARFDLTRMAGSPTAAMLFETEIFTNKSYYLLSESDTVFETGNTSRKNETLNITSYLRTSSADLVSILTFGSGMNATVNYNYSIDYVYNRSINVSVYNINFTILNPTCLFNGDTIYPKTELLNYTSTEPNLLNCSLAGYSSFARNITPELSYYNYSMDQSIVTILIYDEETDQLLSENISINIIRVDYSINATVVNGNITIDNVPAGDIEIRYGGGSYVIRSYYTTIITDTTLELYALKSANASLVIFTIIDERGEPVSGAYLKTQKYFINDNAYKLVSMERTDINGVAGLYLVPYTVPYVFIVEKDGVVVFTSSTTGTKIFTSDVSIRVNILGDVLESYYNLNKYLSASLTYDNSTKIFTYIWNDASGLVNVGCLKVEKYTATGITTIGPSCAASSSGTINIDINAYYANNTRFKAYGYVQTSTQYSLYAPTILEIVTLNPIFNVFGKTGLFFGYLFIVTMFFIGLSLNPSIAIVYTALSMVLLNITGIALFGWAMIISVTFIGLLFALMSEKR